MIQNTILPVPNSPKPKISPVILGVAIGIFFTITLVYAYYFGTSQSQNKPTSSSPTPTPVALTPTSAPAIPSNQIIWLDKPQKIEPLNIFVIPQENSEEYHLSDARYYQTATLPDGSKLINVFLPTEGMGIYDSLYRFIKSPDNKISFIDQNNQWKDFKTIFSPQISLSSFSVRELNPPESLNIDNNYFNKGYLKEGTFDKVENPKLIKETDFGSLYVVYNPDKVNPDIRSREFYLKLKDWTYFTYEERMPFMSDDMTAYIQWNDGTTTKSQFITKIKSGCGTGFFGPDTIKDGSSLLNSKEAVASYNQKSMYQIKDEANQVLKDLYQSYKTGRDYPSGPLIVSYPDFVKAKNHFLYQDFLGDWLLFVNQDYATMAECGKPVIYLYPTKDTQVSVKVAANITKSEPTYPSTGWTVLAHPNGQLDYQGQAYPNLFWEGTGHGPYPSLDNRGFVVAQKDLISTIKQHLSLQGLNQQETADFLEFWQPKLPTTPYVRLTWLTTNEMNTLAPLNISPKPNTIIRVFLDFAGLEKPVNLVPQKLSALPRKGFTLIEWGGLLIK